MNTLASLQEKIDNAKTLDFGDILSRTFDLFKKTWLNGFVFVLMLLVMISPFIIALYVPMFGSIMEQAQSGDYDPNDASSFIRNQPDSFRYMLLGYTFIISLISTGLVAGFYRVVKRIDFDEIHSFSDYFYFFKGKYLGKVFAIASFSLLIALVNFAVEKFLPPAAASLINGILSLVLSVYTTLFVVFLAYNPHLETSDFFTLSFSLGSKKWFLIFALMIITVIIGLLGMVACFIGALFTISIVYLPVYQIYKDVVGFDNLSAIDKIGSE